LVVEEAEDCCFDPVDNQVTIDSEGDSESLFESFVEEEAAFLLGRLIGAGIDNFE